VDGRPEDTTGRGVRKYVESEREGEETTERERRGTDEGVEMVFNKEEEEDAKKDDDGDIDTKEEDEDIKVDIEIDNEEAEEEEDASVEDGEVCTLDTCAMGDSP
jgi:hypothetical protein